MKIMMADVYAFSLINDFEIEKMLNENPALYLRRMYGYLSIAINLIHTPIMYTNPKIDPPLFADLTIEMDGTTNIWTTNHFNFELAVVTQVDEDGNILDKPDVVYDPITGIITFSVTPDAGMVMMVDFYCDGIIELGENAVNEEDYKHLLRHAMLVAWNNRFTSSALDRVQKPSDRTFSVASEANWLRENSNEARRSMEMLNTEMIRVEQKIVLQNRLKRVR